MTKVLVNFRLFNFAGSQLIAPGSPRKSTELYGLSFVMFACVDEEFIPRRVTNILSSSQVIRYTISGISRTLCIDLENEMLFY